MNLDIVTVPTPIGPLTLIAHGEALVGLEFSDHLDRVGALYRRLERGLGAFELCETRNPAGAATRLDEYFGGDLAALDRQPVELHGTPFQRAVWNALREIPVGRTWSYGALAAHVGARNAQRAVGAANGSNPVALFVPCHRVIAANGTLHGYGGGLDRKQWLLAHEGARAGELPLATLHPARIPREVHLV
jgi:methylated-DNA-[protein]-cysteine S-methyltransferase